MKDVWINAEKLMEATIKSQRNNPHQDHLLASNHYHEHAHFLTLIRNQDHIDPLTHGYVTLDAYQQVAWERDIAMSYLEDAGVGFGEKAEIQRVAYGYWIDTSFENVKVCSVCGKLSSKVCINGEAAFDYTSCPYCMAILDGGNNNG